MDRPKRALDLSPHLRRTLERIAADPANDHQLQLRAQLILDWADGLTGLQSAQLRHTSRRTVCKWRCRFRAGGVAALEDLPRPGAPRTVSDGKIAELLRLRRSPPPQGKQRWTTRMLAHHTGLSQSTIVRLDRELRSPAHDEPEGSRAVGTVATIPTWDTVGSPVCGRVRDQDVDVNRGCVVGPATSTS